MSLAAWPISAHLIASLKISVFASGDSRSMVCSEFKYLALICPMISKCFIMSVAKIISIMFFLTENQRSLLSPLRIFESWFDRISYKNDICIISNTLVSLYLKAKGSLLSIKNLLLTPLWPISCPIQAIKQENNSTEVILLMNPDELTKYKNEHIISAA